MSKPLAWIYEDELPRGYPYDAMFQHSEVREGVRMFPVFAAPLFDKTSCSQCGGEFGPGDQGYSHCSDHATAWQPIETAPEDENILVATTGGWVDTAFWTDEDGEGRKWWWLLSASVYARHPIHPDLIPTHWMPLPKHPSVQQRECANCHDATPEQPTATE